MMKRNTATLTSELVLACGRSVRCGPSASAALNPGRWLIALPGGVGAGDDEGGRRLVVEFATLLTPPGG